MLKPLRIDVRPLPRGSQASPIRGEKFELLGVVELIDVADRRARELLVEASPGPEDDRRQPVLALPMTVPK